ncbi:MAG: hypothetical protein IJC48_02160 [Clostridia bacterium]|nr:hypothetical protein [Clostridia bacterium]
MEIRLPIEELKKFLETNEDCEALTQDEYVSDLYDGDTPLTVNLRLEDGKAVILAAARLLYDEEQDGWYMGERVEDEDLILRAFESAMTGGK